METSIFRYLLLVVSLFTGCAVVGPDYKKPELPVPDHWKQAPVTKNQTSTTENTQWWQTFADPVLNELVEFAVNHNLDLDLAEFRIQESRALHQVATTRLSPTSNVSASVTPAKTSNSPGIAQPQKFFHVGFDATWEIDLFGGIKRSIEAADATLEATIEDSRSVLITLLGDVAKNYIDMRNFQQQLAITRANLRAQQDTFDLTKVRYQSGLTTDLDVARAESLVNATAAQLPTLEANLQQSLHRLSVLLGQAPETAIPALAKDAPVPISTKAIVTGLPSTLLQRRPDLRRAERQLAAANAQIGVATADLFPKFSLSALLSLESRFLTDLIPGRPRSMGASLGAGMPLFDAGRAQANVEVQEARTQQARIKYQATLLTALEEVENALVNYNKEQQRYESLAKSVKANERSVQLATERYQKGLIGFLDVLDTQRTLYNAQTQLAQSQASVSIYLVAIYKALGGGWQI